MPHRSTRRLTTGVFSVVIVLGALLVIVGYHSWSASSDAGEWGTPIPSSAAPSPSPSPSPVDPTPQVRAKVAAYLKDSGDHAALALFDRVTGQEILYNGTVRFETASIVKVDILSTLLWQKQNAGTTLSASQRRLATKMITRSDNDAATALFHQIGGAAGLRQGNQAFGLSHTTPNSAWGLTTTTVADQITLLEVLSEDGGPLTADSRAYVLGLMSQVVSDQSWGVPAAAGDRSTQVYVKNGWLSRSTDNWRWIINSIGRIVEPGHDWLVAVLTNYHPTKSAGISQVEHAADLAVGGLRDADA